MDRRSGIINPEAPFSFELGINYIQTYPATRDDYKIEPGQLIKAFRIGSKTFAMQIFNRGNIEQPQLKISIMATDSMTDEELEMAIQKIRFFLGVDDSIKAFYERGYQDSMFEPIINNLYGLHMIRFFSFFEATAWNLMRSNLTLKEAIQGKKSLQRRLGDMININGINYRTFPEPHDIIEAPDDEYEIAIPHELIRERLYTVAATLNDTSSESLLEYSNDEIKDLLLQFDGIDQGTALNILTYGLGRMNEIHHENPDLVKAIEKTYGTHHEINREKIREIADKYGKWKAYWGHYLMVNHHKLNG